MSSRISNYRSCSSVRVRQEKRQESCWYLSMAIKTFCRRCLSTGKKHTSGAENQNGSGCEVSGFLPNPQAALQSTRTSKQYGNQSAQACCARPFFAVRKNEKEEWRETPLYRLPSRATGRDCYPLAPRLIIHLCSQEKLRRNANKHYAA